MLQLSDGLADDGVYLCVCLIISTRREIRATQHVRYGECIRVVNVVEIQKRYDGRKNVAVALNGSPKFRRAQKVSLALQFKQSIILCYAWHAD